MEETNIELLGVENVKNELDKLIQKKTKKLAELKGRPFKVVVNDTEYYHLHELENDYGGGCISKRVYETGRKAFEYHKYDEQVQLVNEEIKVLSQLYWAMSERERLMREMLEDEEKN